MTHARDPFSYNPQDLGNRYLATIAEQRNSTAEEFDRLSGSNLSSQVGPDRVIKLLKLVKVGSGEVRWNFFLPSNSSVSKWARYVTAYHDLGIEATQDSDVVGHAFWIFEGEQNMGKRGKHNVLIVEAEATAEDIAAAGGVAQAVSTASLSGPAKASPTSRLTMLQEYALQVASGLDRQGLSSELAVADPDATDAELREAINGLIRDRKLKVQAGKFVTE